MYEFGYSLVIKTQKKISYGPLSQLFLFENLYLQNVEMASDSIQSNKEGKKNIIGHTIINFYWGFHTVIKII